MRFKIYIILFILLVTSGCSPYKHYGPNTGRNIASDPLDRHRDEASAKDELSEDYPYTYYAERCIETGCAYYCDTAPSICYTSWFNPIFWGIKDSSINCIRNCLVREDKKVSESTCYGEDSCLTDDIIDGYHWLCYQECGVNPDRYPGVNPFWLPFINPNEPNTL